MSRPDPIAAGPDAVRPFARLSLGAEQFLVATPEAPGGLLFRIDAPAAATDDWAPLTSCTEDGWQQIAAEIVRARDGALSRFLGTHAVRVWGDFDRPGDTVDFEIDEQQVRLKPTERGGWVRSGDSDWHEIVLDGDGVAPSRERGIRVLSEAYERGLLELPGYEEWSRRIAMGVQVMPVM